MCKHKNSLSLLYFRLFDVTIIKKLMLYTASLAPHTYIKTSDSSQSTILICLLFVFLYQHDAFYVIDMTKTMMGIKVPIIKMMIYVVCIEVLCASVAHGMYNLIGFIHLACSSSIMCSSLQKVKESLLWPRNDEKVPCDSHTLSNSSCSV